MQNVNLARVDLGLVGSNSKNLIQVLPPKGRRSKLVIGGIHITHTSNVHSQLPGAYHFIPFIKYEHVFFLSCYPPPTLSIYIYIYI